MICLNYLLSFRRSFWNFCRMWDLFSLDILVSDKHTFDAMCHAMYDCEWMNVWVLRFIFCLNSFRIYCSFLLLCFLRACFSSLLCFCPLLRNIFCPDDSLQYHNFSVFGVWILWFIDSFLVGKQIDFSFFVLDFILDFRVVNKFKINNENLPKQCTYSVHVNKIKCTLHPKKTSI